MEPIVVCAVIAWVAYLIYKRQTKPTERTDNLRDSTNAVITLLGKRHTHDATACVTVSLAAATRIAVAMGLQRSDFLEAAASAWSLSEEEFRATNA